MKRLDLNCRHLVVAEEVLGRQRVAVVVDNERQTAETEVVIEVDLLYVAVAVAAVAIVALVVAVPEVAVAAVSFVVLASISAGFDAGRLHKK